DFVSQLQKEIEEDEGIKFGVVEKHLFANILIETQDHQQAFLGAEPSEKIWTHLLSAGYIDKNSKVQDKLRSDIKANSVDLPYEFHDYSSQIIETLKKVAGNLNIKNAADKGEVLLNKAIYLGEDFKQLWELIKYKTTFKLDFDVEDLIKRCVELINNELVVGKAKFVYGKGKAEIGRGGIMINETSEIQHVFDSQDYQLPDIVSYLQNETQLTRYDHVIFDSEIEAEFARSFEKSADVKVYAKLPGWFKIDTPLGSYNPDWAVLVNQGDEEKLYFVVETKGSILGELLRPSEKAKIDCGREHFKALEVPVKFMVADNFGTFMDQVAG
ncbi:MAG: hypothetical protein WCH01_13930, partial [Methylococcaceae bacterium]